MYSIWLQVTTNSVHGDDRCLSVVLWLGITPLFRRQHFQVSGVDLNPSSSNIHTRILSSNCTFDTIVVLVVMFIT